MSKRDNLIELAALGVAVVAFLALALYQVELPGLEYDEAIVAVPAMQMLRGQPLDLNETLVLHVGPLALPLMLLDRAGAVGSYLLLPFFAVLGVNVVAIRLLPVLGGALTVVLTFLVAKRLFDGRVAAIAALLLAVHPAFVFYTRQGLHVNSLTAMAAMGSLLSLLVWRSTGKAWQLWLGLFLLGLGLSTYIVFVWFIVALAPLFAAYQVLQLARGKMQAAGEGAIAQSQADKLPVILSDSEESRPRDGDSSLSLRMTDGSTPSSEQARARGRDAVPRSFRLSPLAAYLLSPAFFALGASFILVYNMKEGGTLQAIGKNLYTTPTGVSNLDFLANLQARVGSFVALLDGSAFWYLGGPISAGIWPWAFVAAAAALVLSVVFRRDARGAWPQVGLLLGLIGLVLVQGAFTLSGIWPYHLYFILPLPVVVVAVGVYWLGGLFAHTGQAGDGPEARRLRPEARKRMPVLASVVCLLASGLLVGQSLWVDVQYHRVLAGTGGISYHSDAIYGLASYLETAGDSSPIAMDWGIKTSVQVLTEGRISPLDVYAFAPESDPNFYHWLYRVLQEPHRLYIFHAPDSTTFPRFDAFATYARGQGKRPALERTLTTREGKPVFLVYSARGG